MLNHFWETLAFYYKLPSNLSQESEFLVAEREEVTLLHKPEVVHMLGREGPRLPVITFKDAVVAYYSRQVFLLSTQHPCLFY